MDRNLHVLPPPAANEGSRAEPLRYNNSNERLTRHVMDMTGIPYLRLVYDRRHGNLKP